MIYPDNFESKIGFDTIREMVMEECRNAISREAASGIGFTSEYSEIILRTELVAEYLKLITEVYGYPDPVVEDYSLLLESIKVPGSWFEPEELPGFHEALDGMARYLDFFSRNDRFPCLCRMSEPVFVERELVDTTGDLLDEQGCVRDSASPELAAIRKDIRTARGRIERVLRKILKEAVKDGIVSGETEYTVKNGRYVIPVPSARKRQLKGYVHDESATGQTLYIEPAEVLELLNEVRELELAERREIIRILVQLADRIRPLIPDLRRAFVYAGELDFIRAKARLAMKTGGVKPEIVSEPVIKWRSAVHPLLFLSLKEQGRQVVPLDIHLEGDQRILVISGPNAGGKSVCLKTVGLLQYMLQCGLLIPVHPNSVFGIFKSVFIDIGDEQSIENDLSTYSSHLINIRVLLQSANKNTLFLIDEMGSGTEPNTGGAIAESALEMVTQTGAFGVVTTHYSNLKLMAGNVPGIVNGAMLFDTKTMQPVYRLLTGRPGSSFAFEIAGKSGIPEELLNIARDKVGKAHYEFDVQIQQLEAEKEALEKKQQELKVADSFVAEMIEKYTTLYQKLDASRKEILQKAMAEAKMIVEQSNRLIEKAVKEIREAGAGREEIKKIRSDLKQELVNVANAEIKPLEVKGKPEAVRIIKEKKVETAKTKSDSDKPIEKVKAGDWVIMKGHNQPGEILNSDGKKAVVTFGMMKVTVNVTQLEWSSPGTVKRTSSVSYNSVLKEINEKSSRFSPEIDLRGMRAVDALAAVKALVDDAMLLNVKDLRILHGKGDGILRQVIRNYLEGQKEVKSFDDEHIERGGHGITIVHLR